MTSYFSSHVYNFHNQEISTSENFKEKKKKNQNKTEKSRFIEGKKIVIRDFELFLIFVLYFSLSTNTNVKMGVVLSKIYQLKYIIIVSVAILY